jgi:RecA-family ATPase
MAYLHTLAAGVPTVANVGYYAEIITNRASLRRLIQAGQRIAQMGYAAADGADDEGTVSDVIQRAAHELDLVKRQQLTSKPTDVDVHDLLAESLQDRWIVDGLLSEGERFLLTAAEGLGKSTFLRQIAVCAAAGIHPFTHQAIRPVRVLGVDCENGRRLSQDRYGRLVRQAARSGSPVQPGQLRLEIRPRGLDLLQSKDASMLLRIVERFTPEIVMIGPVYRLHSGDPNDERSARQVAVVLDQVREVSGAAIVTEHHMAKESGGVRRLTPVGSGLWMRWPEYGYGLVLTSDSDLTMRHCRLQAWRGPRDERSWPTDLISGVATGKPWPWATTR